jgi:hypothetical protein
MEVSIRIRQLGLICCDESLQRLFKKPLKEASEPIHFTSRFKKRDKWKHDSLFILFSDSFGSPKVEMARQA